MTRKWIAKLDSPDVTLASVGGKAASLSRLAQANFPVPGGYYVTTTAYWYFVEKNELQTPILEALVGVDGGDPSSLQRAATQIEALFAAAAMPPQLAEAIADAYALLPGSQPAVAVRSSATAEDLPGASFAGQQQTFLNIEGERDVLQRVRDCWASLWTARAIDYRARQGIASNEVALAVVVQLLIPADAAGVLFTANPINGRRDQFVMSASWGLGEAVVAGLVTPDRIVVDKASGKVIAQDIGDKKIEITPVAGGTVERPLTSERRLQAVLTAAQIKELAQAGQQIERLYGYPMDIEWAIQDGRLSILQARPITALSEPVPTSWQLPQGAYSAMRNNIVELMADPLSPLFGTLGLQAVNVSMSRMVADFLGSPDILPEEPIIRVNEYAYYNGSIRLGKIVKILVGAVGIARRMFTGAVARWTEHGLPQYIAIVDHWEAQPWQAYDSPKIIAAVKELTEAAIDAYGAMVSGVIPAAWISEGLFTFFYRFSKKKGDPEAPVFLMGFDSLPIRAEKSLYDLAQWVRSDSKLREGLENISTSQLVAAVLQGRLPDGVPEANWLEMSSRLHGYFSQFGHMIYNLDFASPVPLDDPAPVLETFLMFVRGQGTNPHSRQQEASERRDMALGMMTARLRGRRLLRFRKRLARAQKYAPLREDGLADLGLAYPLLRRMLLEVGQRFTKQGVITEPGAIYWLTGPEVETVAAGTISDEDLSAQIAKRKAVWQAARQAVPPLMLPQKMLGIDIMALKAGKRKRQEGVVEGVAASPGQVTAPACVVRGPEDFGKMMAGDVLIAPLTTPAWTPLFARAAAVVTDVGGPLSHGSIVAREYGIPAVLGTGDATRRFQDGQLITVDGTAGLVTIVAPAPNGDGTE